MKPKEWEKMHPGVKYKSPEGKLLRHLEAGKKITTADSWSVLGMVDMYSIVKRLRAKGYPIWRDTVIVRNKFDEKVSMARYEIEKD